MRGLPPTRSLATGRRRCWGLGEETPPLAQVSSPFSNQRSHGPITGSHGRCGQACCIREGSVDTQTPGTGLRGVSGG